MSESNTKLVEGILANLPMFRHVARVRLPANKTIIASRLGITKEIFSRLLHELSAPERSGARRRRRAGGEAGVEHALGSVLAEIDEIAKATFRSISIAAMLKLVERRRA